eukprot:jgi/Ulvmu1/9741/UM055_0081.1
MSTATVADQPAARLGFFIAVRSTLGGPEGTLSACLAYHSRPDYANDIHLGWAEAVVPFCFPLGPSDTLQRKPEPFHFMPPDGSGTHGFCRQIAVPSRSREFVACLLAPWPWFQALHHATDVLAFLLSAAIQTPRGPPATLPATSQARSFLLALHAAIAANPLANTILQIPLPPRNDYPFAPLHPIAITLPTLSKGPSVRRLRTGQSFTEIQVPPQPVTLAAADPARIVAPLAALVHALPPPALACLAAALLTERPCLLISASPARAATATAAAATLLTPLHWRVTLLPLVPAGRLDLLAGPRPVLAGLPAALRAAGGVPTVPGRLEVDLDTGTVQPPIGSIGCCSRVLPGWQRLCSDFESLKAHVTSPNDYTCNAAITSAMHGFLAATLGTYRDHIKGPAAACRAATASSGTSKFSKSLMRALSAPLRLASDMSGRLRSVRSARVERRRGGAATAVAPAAPVFMPEDHIVNGEGGWRFHHEQFAAALATQQQRELAGLLIQTTLWAKFIQDRIALMQQPARSGSTDAFELRVLAHLNTQHARSTAKTSTLVALPTRQLRVPRFRIGAAFPSYGGKRGFDPYDPFDISEEDEFDENEDFPQAYAAVTATLRATASHDSGGGSSRLGGVSSRLGGASSRLTGGHGGASAQLTPGGASAALSAGSADDVDGNDMRKLGDISHDLAVSASLQQQPQLQASMQSAQGTHGTQSTPYSFLPLPPTANMHPTPQADKSCSYGAVSGGGGLAMSSAGSMQSLHSAALTTGTYLPDC